MQGQPQGPGRVGDGGRTTEGFRTWGERGGDGPRPGAWGGVEEESGGSWREPPETSRVVGDPEREEGRRGNSRMSGGRRVGLPGYRNSVRIGHTSTGDRTWCSGLDGRRQGLWEWEVGRGPGQSVRDRVSPKSLGEEGTGEWDVNSNPEPLVVRRLEFPPTFEVQSTPGLSRTGLQWIPEACGPPRGEGVVTRSTSPVGVDTSSRADRCVRSFPGRLVWGSVVSGVDEGAPTPPNLRDRGRTRNKKSRRLQCFGVFLSQDVLQ